MKILIDIPNKFIEIVKGLLLGTCIDKEDEQEVYEAVDIALSTDKPLLVFCEQLLDKDCVEQAQYSQLMLFLATAALVQIKQQQTSKLSERLETMQKQVEELQRKNND